MSKKIENQTFARKYNFDITFQESLYQRNTTCGMTKAPIQWRYQHPFHTSFPLERFAIPFRNSRRRY